MSNPKKTRPARAWMRKGVEITGLTAILLLIPSAVMFQTAKAMDNLDRNPGALGSVADPMFYAGMAAAAVAVVLWIACRLTDRRQAGTGVTEG